MIGIDHMENNDWIRKLDLASARAAMIQAERTRRYEDAALAAITLADFSARQNDLEDTASFERQALVYAVLHQASTALFIAENR